MGRWLAIILLLLVGVASSAQQYAGKEYYLVDSLDLSQLSNADRNLVDSCLKLYHNADHDTDKVNAINVIVEESWDDNVWPIYNNWVYEFVQEKLMGFSGPPTTPQHHSLMVALAGAINNIGYIHKHQGDIPLALEYYHKSLKILEELGNKQGIANSLNNIGMIHKNQGDIPLALEYYHKSLKIQEQLGNKQGMAASLNNIGYIHKHQGDIPLALEYFHKSLKIDEELSNKIGIAYSLNNIGTIHYNQDDISLALEYYHKGLKNYEELGNKIGMANSLNNIGLIHSNQGDIPLALEYYHKSLKNYEELGYKIGMAISLNNIGYIHDNQGDIPLALEYYHKSLKIQEELGNKEGMAISLNNIGSLEITLAEDGKAGALAGAEKNLKRGLNLAREIGSPARISTSSSHLCKIAKMENNYKEALEMYELHIQMRDSIKNEETQKAAIRQQTKYEFEKAQLVKEQEEKEQARIDAEQIDRRNSLQYSIILVGILVVFGLVLSLGVVSVSPKVAEGLIFFAFLILFEFLLVLSDPYVDSITGGAPAYKLLANAVLAGLIFPAHSFFERVLKKRLIDNKRKDYKN